MFASRVAELCPIDIRAHVFAADRSAGNSLHIRAALGRDAANTVFPL